MKSKIYIKLLALLGFGTGISACAYGTPMYGIRGAEYVVDISGRVTNEAGISIEGIKVSSPTLYYYPNALMTDVNGYYHIDGTLHTVGGVQLEFDDIDSEANGGDFESATIVVDKDTHNAPTVQLKIKE